MSTSTLKPVIAIAATVAPLAAVLLGPAGVANATEPVTASAADASDYIDPLSVWNPLRQQVAVAVDDASVAPVERTALDAESQSRPTARGEAIGAGLPDYPAHVFPSAEAGAIIGGLTGGAIGGITGVAFGMGVGCVAGLPFLIVGCPVGAILGGTIGFAIGTTVGSVAGVVLGASDGIARQMPPPAPAAAVASQGDAVASPRSQPDPQDVAMIDGSTHDSGLVEQAGIDLAAVDRQIQLGLRQAADVLGIPAQAAG